jgi:outer membrane protein TolC
LRGVAGVTLAAVVGTYAPPATADDYPSLSPRRVAVLALAHSPAAAAASSARAETGAAVRLAAQAFRPELWASTTPGYSGGLPGGPAGHLPAIATIDLRQTAYDASRHADVLEAQARDALQAGDVEIVKQDVVRSALLAYGRCWYDAELAANATSKEKVAASARARAEALASEGRLTLIDVERAALAEAQARQQRLDRESDRDLDQRELRQLVGWPPNAPLALDVDPLSATTDPVDGADLDTALHNDVTTTDLAEASARWRTIESIRERWWMPSIDLDAQYSRLVRTKGYDDFYRSFKADDWSVGVFVSLPLWTNGRAAAAAARAHAEVDRLDHQGQLRAEQLDLLVQRAEASVARAASALALKERAFGLADEELRLARALEDEKRLGPAEIGVKQAALADANDDLVHSKLELMKSRLSLLEARGELLRGFTAD